MNKNKNVNKNWTRHPNVFITTNTFHLFIQQMFYLGSAIQALEK